MSRPLDILAPIAVEGAKRALALTDLNRTSATYGCADRDYWYYRTLTNFSGSTFQSAMLGLAALVMTPHDGNPYLANKSDLFEASGAMLGWWSKIAHRDGAFDEWYLNEHSYCPTAITGGGAAQTLDLIGEFIPAATRDAGMDALRRAGDWLKDRYNPVVMNQNLAAVVTLAGLAKLDGKARWREAAEAKLAKIAADQHAEGWLPEYSGADLGYSSLALDLLASIDKFDIGLQQVRPMASRLEKFLVQAQGGWRSPGGRIGSRGTAHAFPFGALYFAGAGLHGSASRLAADWLAGIESGCAPRPADVDDRYFAYFYFPQFALAYQEALRQVRIEFALPESAAMTDGVVDLAGSGFVAVRRGGLSALVSRRTGGALAVSGAEKPPLYHLGYEIDTDKGRFSSANWDEEMACTPVAGDVVTASSAFRASSSGLPLKTLMAPFQLAVGFLGNSAMAEGFQGMIKNKMVAPKAEPGLKLARTVTIAGDSLRVRDELQPRAGLPRISQIDVARTVSMHSPSARQDQGRVVEVEPAQLAQALLLLNAGKPAVIEIVIGAGG